MIIIAMICISLIIIILMICINKINVIIMSLIISYDLQSVPIKNKLFIEAQRNKFLLNINSFDW